MLYLRGWSLEGGLAGPSSAQASRSCCPRAGWSEISRLWDTGLVHTTSSGLREVPDFIELMSPARQSLPAGLACANRSDCRCLSYGCSTLRLGDTRVVHRAPQTNAETILCTRLPR